MPGKLFARCVMGLSGRLSRECEVRTDMQDKPRVKWGEVRIEAVAEISATQSVANGHTGRSVTCDAEYGQVREWARLPKERLVLQPMGERFRTSVHKARRVEGRVLVCYRGVSFEKGHRPRSEEMGPPPEDGFCSEGRYNRENERMLYLCTSERAIVREVAPKFGHSLYNQRYRLLVDQLRIANFVGADVDKFANAVFEIAETCNVEGRGPENYNFSQFVAALVMEAFDGMLVPGVHGDRSLQYANVVVFHPYPKWMEWLEKGEQPRLLHPG